jgi:hypothetical protein
MDNGRQLFLLLHHRPVLLPLRNLYRLQANVTFVAGLTFDRRDFVSPLVKYVAIQW